MAAERVRTIEDQKRILIKSDFTLPINDKTRFEAGYNGRFSTNNTDYSLEFAQDDSFILDSDVSNILLYEENVNALYTQYGSTVKNK